MNAKCRYCGNDDEDRDVCDPCWYGMRLEPERWRARLKAIGREIASTELAVREGTEK